ncbi:hypothetical protein BpHYR1_001755 [Brachionus plicatilis]|uniref:Uncharacterized protein n=1 Tax=Brachionus plicatilis TaxID=10195 RepID=A0A3M7SMS8_BRAPC|nr:hypothetical protein BpHYR1_001755 [Brachionus plicatilis]
MRPGLDRIQNLIRLKKEVCFAQLEACIHMHNLLYKSLSLSRIGLEKSDWEIKGYQQTKKYYSGAQFAEQFTNSKRSERTHEKERILVVV